VHFGLSQLGHAAPAIGNEVEETHALHRRLRPNKHGEQAVALASALALTQGAELELVHVPDGVSARTRLVYAESIAEGLIEAARDVDAALIVVSAARHAPLNRFLVGSVANALLHAAHVPVALVPSGYQRPPEIVRLTAAIGSREGARTLLDIVLAAATRRGLPLRLMSLVRLDREGQNGGAGAARAMLDEAVQSIGSQAQVTSVVAEGPTMGDAVQNLPWDEGEIAIIGSSRLAEHRKIFMGSTANKILRVLPVPLIVVPRTLSTDAPGEL